jgi:hypothetical protein
MAYATAADLDYAPPADLEPAYDPSAEPLSTDPATGSPLAAWVIERSRWTPLYFLLPTALCGISWAGNGITFLSDLGMVFLTILCIGCLLNEFLRFPQRFGIGGFVVYAGTIIWFCHDYLYFWMGNDFRSAAYQPWVVAKTAFLVSLLTFSMSVGLNLRGGRWIPRLASLVPEAGNSGFYLSLLMLLFCLGVLPYFLFVNEPFYSAIYHEIIGMRSGGGVKWTIGRTGLLNTNWSAYAFHLMDVGFFSGMFGSFYATHVARSLPAKLAGWAAFLFWTLIAFGTGTRGYVIAIVLPAMGFLYIKYHIEAAALLKRTSVKAYVVTGFVAVALLAVVQFQGMFRNERADKRTWKELDVTRPRGNHMFSEGLMAARDIPGHTPFFGNRFVGEGAVRILPETAFYALIHPIPRALWTTKPVDAAWEWYNLAFTGEQKKAFNTTIAPGAAVGQYMRYGTAGVVEFGILFGWLAASFERVLRGANGRPIQILTSLAFSVWLFRCFRGGFALMEFYELVIGLTVMSVIVILGQPFFSRE